MLRFTLFQKLELDGRKPKVRNCMEAIKPKHLLKSWL